MEKIKTVIILAIVAIANIAFAQDTLTNKFELGINAFNYTTVIIPTINNSGHCYCPNSFNGIIFKIHSSNHSLRFSADHYNYFKKVTATNAFEADTLNSSNRYRNTLISSGLEKTFLNRKILQAYYGADISLFLGELTGSYISQSALTDFYTDKMQVGVGINPFAGVRLILKNVVLSYEPSVNLLYYKEDENRTYFSPTIEDKSSTTLNFETRPNLINRLSIGLQF